MQSSIKFNNDTKKWEVTKGKNPKKCRKIFNNLINNINLYDGDVPPFFMRKITHKEWKKIKEKTDKWNDVYFDIPPDTISKLYSAKGCKYIQISDNYGLYHLGIDICGFDVLPFITEQQLRVRTKIHSTNKNGFCSLSVTIACQPKKIENLIPSKYSLDNKETLPSNLIYL
jgi:hypothetical protein